MHVASLTTFAADKKEPLADLAARIRQAFLNAGLSEPTIRFTMMAVSPKIGGVSPIDKILKRYPEMERFVIHKALIVGSTPSRMLSNSESGEAVDSSTLLAIAAGVPRTHALNAFVLHFHAPPFGERLIGLPRFGHSFPGVMITDNRAANGRQRMLAVYTVVEAEPGDKQLPPNPVEVDAVLKACGKARGIQQVPILAPGGGLVGSIPAENIAAVKAVAAKYRASFPALVERARLPHDLPPAEEIRLANPLVMAGPRKPALEAVFKPLGYECRGGSGEFHLTRRSAGHLTVDLYLDVGTWSHEVSAMFQVHGAGFRESLGLPVSLRAHRGQYPIGDAAQWRKIVENLAAMVRELDREYVPEIEQAAGPSPAWYQPPS